MKMLLAHSLFCFAALANAQSPDRYMELQAGMPAAEAEVILGQKNVAESSPNRWVYKIKSGIFSSGNLVVNLTTNTYPAPVGSPLYVESVSINQKNVQLSNTHDCTKPASIFGNKRAPDYKEFCKNIEEFSIPNAMKVSTGMSRLEVYSLLGTPVRIRGDSIKDEYIKSGSEDYIVPSEAEIVTKSIPEDSIQIINVQYTSNGRVREISQRIVRFFNTNSEAIVKTIVTVRFDGLDVLARLNPKMNRNEVLPILEDALGKSNGAINVGGAIYCEQFDLEQSSTLLACFNTINDVVQQFRVTPRKISHRQNYDILRMAKPTIIGSRV